MSDIGALVDYSRHNITPLGDDSIGDELQFLQPGIGTNTAVWPSSNLAIFIPFRVGYPFIVVNAFWVNGATVGTNHVDVGVYDSQGNQIAHTGSTITSGATAIQKVSLSATIEPGLHYLAMAVDGTTDNFARLNVPAYPLNRAMGILGQTSAFALPSTATFSGSASTSSYIPMFGITQDTVI